MLFKRIFLPSTFTVCGLLILSPALLRAQSASPVNQPAALEAFDKEIEAKRRELHVPGASIVIVKDDKVIYLKGLGLRDVEQKLPVTPDTVFAIGSSSKAFTAMTVMMSADEGKLALSDSPKKYLPYFHLRDPEADSKITLSDLLCHRSGLDRTDLVWYTGKLKPKEVILAAGTAKPTAKFGEKFQYQNVMFLTAGEIVGTVQHQPWQKFVANRIFKPLRMKDTETSVREMQQRQDYALGYTYDEKKKESVHLPMRDLNCIAPAGAINSNAKDMAQWLRLMLNDGVFEGKRFVSEPNFKELFNKHMTVGGSVGYGYGWFLRDWNGHKVYEHGGNIDGFTAQVSLMPDQKLGMVMLTNQNVTTLGALAMNTLWDKLVGSPKAPADTAVAGPPSDPTQEVGTYHLAAAKLDIVISAKEGKLIASPTGQPSLPMDNAGGRRYKFAPAGIVLTFRPSKENPQETEMVLEQAGATFVCKKVTADAAKPAEFVAPISVDELMQKVIAASGGEDAIRKHHAMVLKWNTVLENQGITAVETIYSAAPNKRTSETVWMAAGKKIAVVRDSFDGTNGVIENSISNSRAEMTGKMLADARLEAAFAPALNWKTLYKTVTIKRMDKVGDEEVYVVEKVPTEGNPITDYISTKSFLLLKSDSRVSAGEDTQVPVSATFSDYRSVEGVVMPFKRVQTVPGQGEVVQTLVEAKFDVPIAEKVFHSAAKKK